MQKKTESGLKQAVKAFSILGGVGIYLVVFVGLCGYIGSLLGDYLQLGKAGIIGGIILGFPAAFYTLYRQLKHNELI
ncbi:MAG: AtpZ/AtpI family protein [Selenomonas sp.]|nr:AtpZ/AtpI family protein [Selenomonas sp.]